MTQLSPDLTVAGQPLFSSSSTAMHVVGSRINTPDGRSFRYCKNGGSAMVTGKLQQAPAEDTTNWQELGIAAATVGDTTVTTTDTVTLAANALAGGLLIISEGSTGQGASYRIKSHPAATAAAVTFTLEDPIHTTTTGTEKVDVFPNPYSGVIIAPTTATSGPVGVSIYPIAANEYGWVQTHGPVACLAQGTVTVGDDVVPANTTTAGTVVAKADATIDAVVGFALTGGASTDHCIIFLTID
jgi:hypothetical protein